MAEPTKAELEEQLKTTQDELEQARAELEEAQSAPVETTLEAVEQQPVNVTIVQPNLAAEGAQNQLEGQEWLRKQEEKAPVYIVNGKKVDPNGEPVKKSEKDDGA